MILHFPGFGKNVHNKLMNDFAYIGRVSTDQFFLQDCTIATISTNLATPLLIQASFNGIPIINLCDNHEGEWKRIDKPKIIQAGLDKIKSKYLLLLDANDVVIHTEIPDLTKLLQYYSKKIVCNATMSMFPPIMVEDIPYRENIFGDWGYLNAGVMFGETEEIKKLYNYIIDEINSGNVVDSEQYYVRKYWSEHPDIIGIDWQRVAFLIINWKMYTGNKYS